MGGTADGMLMCKLAVKHRSAGNTCLGIELIQCSIVGVKLQLLQCFVLLQQQRVKVFVHHAFQLLGQVCGAGA